MTNITNTLVNTSAQGLTSTTPIATPQGTQVQATSSTSTSASVQPYTFVNGPAGPDTTPTSRLSSSGMPAPMVSPQSASESAKLSAYFNALGANIPSDAKAAAEIAKITLMLFQSGIQLRKDSIDNRNSLMLSQQNYKKQAIDKGLDAAYQDLRAGIVSGVGSIVSGGVGAYGSIKAIKDTKLDKSLAPDEALAKQKTAVDMATSKSQAWTSAGSVLNGAFSVGAAAATYYGAQYKAEQQGLDLKAELIGSMSSQDGELANTFRDFYKAQQDTFTTNMNTQTQMANTIKG